jgi:UDP-arabinose 4-epimerase
MPANVLVTGGAGYIGSHTCKALSAAGHRPVTYDSLVHGHRDAVRWGPIVEADLADGARLEQTLREHRICAVIHFAGFTYVGESMTAPGKYFRNNLSNTLVLLDAMAAAGIEHFVFSSTCATYGLPQRIPIAEDHPQNPINPYGESKLWVERALVWYGRAHKLKAVSLRYFNAAGADLDGEIGEEHDPETHLIPLVIAAALRKRERVDVYGTDYPTGDGTAVRDYIHVTDLAQAHVQALDYLRDGGTSTALNLGAGRGHSVREVIRAVERVAGGAVPVRDAARREGDPPVLIASAARARQVLNWAPRHSSLETIVETAWRWHVQR